MAVSRLLAASCLKRSRYSRSRCRKETPSSSHSRRKMASVSRRKAYASLVSAFPCAQGFGFNPFTAFIHLQGDWIEKNSQSMSMTALHTRTCHRLACKPSSFDHWEVQTLQT